MITKLRSRLNFAKVLLAASLFALITQISFAETLNPFAGNYVGAKLGLAKGDAISSDSGYNSHLSGERGFVGDYNPDGKVIGLFGGHNFLINDLYFFGTEFELGKLNIKEEKQLPDYVGVRGDDSIAMTSDGRYFSPGLRFGLLKDNSNYFIKVGKVYSRIKQSYRDNDPTGTTLVPQAESSNLRGNSFGFGFEHFNNGLVYRADFSKINFGSQQMETTNNFGNSFVFHDKLKLKIFSIGISKKF